MTFVVCLITHVLNYDLSVRGGLASERLVEILYIILLVTHTCTLP